MASTTRLAQDSRVEYTRAGEKWKSSSETGNHEKGMLRVEQKARTASDLCSFAGADAGLALEYSSRYVLYCIFVVRIVLHYLASRPDQR